MRATLSAVRRNAKMTARQMATACGVGYNKVFDWEQGRAPIPEECAKVYCKHGGCTIDDLKDCEIIYLRKV